MTASVTSDRALFLRLREEFRGIVSSADAPYSPDELIRHAYGGSVKFADCRTVAEILRRETPQRMLEVGCFLGFSSRWLLEVGTPWAMRLTSVDPNVRHRVFDEPRRFVETFNARFIPERHEVVTAFFGAHGDDVDDYENHEPRRDREWVRALVRSRPTLDGSWERRFDAVFIDGDHSYAATVDNFRHAVRLLNPGGFLLFHDVLTWPSVRDALTDLQAEYGGAARLEVLSGLEVFEHPAMRSFSQKASDGIGLFRLLA